ncbi:MAG: calcium/sodium antiporter [Bacteroidales bacterium]|nr:calcium/sodium antiporter [Bacteroidales bacterium]MBQ6579139.1 calcium/sodium antiporter [Bacteroidales bacterium]
MTIIWLLVGLGLIVLGADWLVEGASSIARKAGVSEFVIGLTIVGFGTSCPELVVSLTGALEGNADIAVGNVVGSNIFNVLFILGLTSLLCPVSMTEGNRKKDIPITLIVTLLSLAVGLNHTLWGIGEADCLSRWEGGLFLAIFAAYVAHSFLKGQPAEEGAGESKSRKLGLAILLSIAGLAGLIFGGNLFVDSATDLARMLGVSDKFIAVTILAGGTSLPELATSLVAALKGRDQLALGNILGSNVFNILLILGSSALITPLSLASVTSIDALVLTLSVILSLLWAYTGNRERIDRWEGIVMLLLFGAYYTYLFINQ